MKLMCYTFPQVKVDIEPGRIERSWMGEAQDNGPYRCLPLTIANSTGWQLKLPFSLRATWNGGARVGDVVIDWPSPATPLEKLFAVSHFGLGILTFHVPMLFRTEPGWDLWVGGAPNEIKHGIQALTGIVETSWLSMPFTMNWRFTAPGTVEFAAGDAFAFIMPVLHRAIDDVDPVITPLSADQYVHDLAYAELWDREKFNQACARREPEAIAQGWQKHYFKGVRCTGEKAGEDHIQRRRLKSFRPARDGE